MTRRTLLTLALVLLPVATACGGGGGTSQPAGSIKVTMTDFKFDPGSISASHGKVVFFLVNQGSSAHDFVIQDASGSTVSKSDMVQPSDAGVFTVNNLAAGHYQVICDVPGHKEAGMTATLDVS